MCIILIHHPLIKISAVCAGVFRLPHEGGGTISLPTKGGCLCLALMFGMIAIFRYEPNVFRVRHSMKSVASQTYETVL